VNGPDTGLRSEMFKINLRNFMNFINSIPH